MAEIVDCPDCGEGMREGSICPACGHDETTPTSILDCSCRACREAREAPSLEEPYNWMHGDSGMVGDD